MRPIDKIGYMEPRVLAIVPAYNEQDSIVATVEDLRTYAPDVDYIVVNDGSKDNTEKICQEQGYNHLSLPVNLGLAGGFRTGMKYAYSHGYDYVVQFDADGQHSAAFIRSLVDKAIEDGADIVIGSRFCTQKKPITPRMMGSSLITLMIKLTTGTKLTDPTSGMRLFDKEMIELFASESDFSPEPDTIAHLARGGAKISEVQVEMRERMAGESYLNLSRSVTYMLRVCISILFIQWFRKKV